MVYSSVHLCIFIFKISLSLLPFTSLSYRHCLVFIPYVFFGHSVYFPFAKSSFTFSNFYIDLSSAPVFSATQLSSSFAKG
jgi:hypothetical protein